MAKFPTSDWVQALVQKLNTDEKYAQVARNWEGDMGFLIEAGEGGAAPTMIYLDLWHGACRGGYVVEQGQEVKPAFVLSSSLENYHKLLHGELEPMQALLTRKIGVQGNFAVIMRSVPTVLDFVRCAREVTDPA
jgi:putative sterol carrier protein